MATTIDRAVQEAPERSPEQRQPRKGWGLRLSGAALAAVAVAAVVFFWPSSSGQAPEERETTSLYTAREQQVMQMVNEGQVPAETLQGGVYLIKSMVNRGLIPAATLRQYQEPVDSLYTKQELRIMALVAQGVLPPETLNGEPFRTKRLINQGLIPREGARPAPPSGR